jgi:hypothetical protein
LQFPQRVQHGQAVAPPFAVSGRLRLGLLQSQHASQPYRRRCHAHAQLILCFGPRHAIGRRAEPPFGAAASRAEAAPGRPPAATPPETPLIRFIRGSGTSLPNPFLPSAIAAPANSADPAHPGHARQYPYTPLVLLEVFSASAAPHFGTPFASMFAPMHGVTPSCRKLLNQKLSMTAPPRRPFPFLAFVSLLLLPVLLTPRDAGAQARIKDITDVQGIRDNQLVGYGLVVGLNNTGDSLQNAVFTKQSLVGMLGRLGINTQALASQLQTKDVAAVMVTADLPAFIRTGERIDVTASAMGDAKDLTGGTLLVTPLLGADGQVYAVAQGSLVIPAPSPPPVPTAASRRACPP